MSVFENSKVPSILGPTENDIALMLAAKCHLGTQNVSSRMTKYVFSRRADGLQIIHLGKTWEKLILAARVLATLEPESIYVTFSTSNARRPAIKLVQYIGGKTNQDRFVPGTFTSTLEEPSILVCMDPMTDFQAVQESNRCNMPVIAFTNTHCSLKYVDLAIPCNNMGSQSLGLMCWFLSRAILRLRGALSYDPSWDVLPDMFFYSDIIQEEAEHEAQAHPYEPMQKQGNWSASANFDQGEFSYEIQDASNSWSGGEVLNTGDWASEQKNDQFELPKEPSNWAEDVPEEGWGNQPSTSPWMSK